MTAEIGLYSSKEEYLAQFAELEGFDCLQMDECREYMTYFIEFGVDLGEVIKTVHETVQEDTNHISTVLDKKTFYTTSLFKIDRLEDFSRLVGEGQL